MVLVLAQRKRAVAEVLSIRVLISPGQGSDTGRKGPISAVGRMADIGGLDTQGLKRALTYSSHRVHLGMGEQRQEMVQHLARLAQLTRPRPTVGQRFTLVWVPRKRVPQHAVAATVQGGPHNLGRALAPWFANACL